MTKYTPEIILTFYMLSILSYVFLTLLVLLGKVSIM